MTIKEKYPAVLKTIEEFQSEGVSLIHAIDSTHYTIASKQDDGVVESRCADLVAHMGEPEVHTTLVAEIAGARETTIKGVVVDCNLIANRITEVQGESPQVRWRNPGMGWEETEFELCSDVKLKLHVVFDKFAIAMRFDECEWERVAFCQSQAELLASLNAIFKNVEAEGFDD